MTNDGKLYPVISFDQIIDTDFGLIEIINNKYHDTDTFYWSLLEAPAKFKVGLLYNRIHPNPLTVIAKDRENIELLDDYYNQFMEEEYVAILKQSIITELYKVLKKLVNTEGVYPLIVCKSPLEKTYFEKIDKETFNKCTVTLSDSLSALLKDKKYSPIYIKNIRDTASIINELDAQTLYIAGYRFNFEDNERQHLLNEYSVLLSGINRIKVYETYTKDDIIQGV